MPTARAPPNVPMVARYMAISEAMERWAFRIKVRAPDRELYGFDIDESSNGMAAFPGLFHTEARKRALLEAVERSSVIAWWEGVLDGEVRSTDWPGISALVLPSPIGFGLTVVAFREVRPGCFAYGHGAAKDFFGAAERAVMELARNEYVLDLRRVSQGLAAEKAPSDLFERRCLFFSSAEGHAMFQERIHRKIDGTAVPVGDHLRHRDPGALVGVRVGVARPDPPGDDRVPCQHREVFLLVRGCLRFRGPRIFRGGPAPGVVAPKPRARAGRRE